MSTQKPLITYKVGKTQPDSTEDPKVFVLLGGLCGEQDVRYDMPKSVALDLARELLDVVAHLGSLGH